MAVLGLAHSIEPQVPHGLPTVPPVMGPQPLHALSALWHEVPSQHPPLQVSPPAQLVPHVPALHA
jgi:hypothetical protein